MNEIRIIEELLALLEDNSVKVREEPLGGSGGGLCIMKGENIFFKDTQAPAFFTATMCAKAVAKIIDIEQIYIRPEIREFIENFGEL